MDVYIAVMVVYFGLRLSIGNSPWPMALMSDFLHLVLIIAIPVLTLAVVSRQKWRMLFASILVAAWIALYGLHLITRFVPKATCNECKSVVLMTFNVGSGLIEPVTLAAYLRNSDADIIGLQELTAAHAAVLQSQLGNIYPYQAYSDEIFQLGLLSKYPITEVQEHYGPSENDAKYIQAVIELNGKNLTVVVTRLKPPRLGGYTTGFGYWVWSTADDLVHIAGEYSPAAVLIDMNASNQSTNFAKLARSGLKDAFQESGSGYGATFPARTDGWHTLPGITPPLLRIDYVMVSERIDVIRALNGAGVGSDHLPVFAEIRLP